LTVTVAVSGGAGNPTPTGTVTLKSGTYTSSAATLSVGAATIDIPAGSLATGADTLTVSYTPDTASAETYYSATGTSSVTVAAPAKITPAVTVTPSASSITTAQALTVTVTVSAPSGDAAPTGTVTLTSGSYTSTAMTLEGTPSSAPIIIPAGSLAKGTDTLTVSYTPDAASSSAYSSASGTSWVTVAAPAKITPAVTVTPPASGVTTTQAFSVSVAVSGGSGNPTPTGSVTLTSGSYTSAAATLSSGGATINVPAGSLAAGTDTLTVSYTPDTASSATYNSAAGTNSVTVTKTTPAVTVTPSPSSITIAQALTVTVAVSGTPTPAGSVTLTSGSYTSAAATLSSGGATINVPAGSLAAGIDTLTVSYTPDTASSSIYNSASGTGSVTVTGATTYTLTVDSTAPASGVDIQAIPSDNNNNGYGPTPMTLTYNAGTAVALSAPATSQGYSFVSWTGCATSTAAGACTVTMNANMTVTANYNKPSVTSITVTPSTATIGTPVQFVANVAGTGNYSKAVTWTLACSTCTSQVLAGTLSSGGLYTTPYPAPASVTVTATSALSGYTNISGSVTVTLNPPAAATGPALTVDAGNPTHAISPDIYGMDAYLLDATTAQKANISIDRWGGDSTERYNYQLDVTSSISDWYFENQGGTGGDGLSPVSGVKAFDALVERNAASGVKTLGTVPVLGWVAKDSTSCSFPVATYPGQQKVDTSRQCGNGVYPEGVNGCTSSGGCRITGNNPLVTSISEPPPTPPAASAVTASWADATWTGSWVNYLVGKFGPGDANNGTSGVAIYDLDNEPSWWDAGSFDVHPDPFTYDEVTNGGIGTALAIKTVDSTAEVSGPVMDYWWDYFYSKKDVEAGWGTGPCWEPWSNPADRTAHGGIPFIEYYLQQFAAAENTYGKRLLDYVDLHTYFAAQYPTGSGNSVAFATAGNTGMQQARMNSTRVFWDPTYTDASGQFPQPNYSTDPSSLSCTVPQQAPQLIPMMKNWVAADYPGTKLAIDEYNWGGLESINGAVTQADILGIFGREGLDLGTLWPTTNPSQQVPGTMAFAMYRNYDGNKSTFGDTALASTSTNSSNADAEGQLAVYGALRTSDNAVTVMVINKTFGPLTSTLSLAGVPATTGTAQAYLYSNANLAAIVAQPAVTVTPPAGGSTTSTIGNYTFPAQSITLFVVTQ
jgi:hypothetical protein